jgi:hypothetical protein
VLTSTDIPPGGEGKIEVTFDSGNKKGQQKKSITVESNDPRNPRATLNISALIEVVFGFEEYLIDMGRIRKGQLVTKTATLIVKDQSLIKTLKFTSSSPNITANLSKTPTAEKGRLTVEISGTSEMPVGRISATIMARAGKDTVSEATLQINGAVIGNVDITPEVVQFYMDTSKSDSDPAKQIIRVISTVDEARLHLLRILDVDQRLIFKIDTLLADKQYEISVTPKPAVIRARQSVSGAVIITTDDKERPVTTVPYSIFYGP